MVADSSVFHRRRAAREDQAVRVVARRQGDEAQRQPGLEQRQRALGRARRGALAGGVAVEAQDRLGREPPHQLDLRFGQRGAERRHRFRYAGALQCDHVHVAFQATIRPFSRAAGVAVARP